MSSPILAQQHLENGEFAAEWRGFLFVRGHSAGADSVARLCRELRQNGPEQALGLARGSFSLSLLDKRTRTSFICSDPFALVQVLAAGDQAGNDLIGLIRVLPKEDASLNRDGLAAFLRYGCYTLGNTIDRRVRALSGGEILAKPAGAHGWQRFEKA
ncbi:MAG: hypothetical protein JOY77_00965, partial [Alphaproteobacteria bacterium]|nr:hypothetical protein [Alphaproteobacteria bacterium]